MPCLRSISDTGFTCTANLWVALFGWMQSNKASLTTDVVQLKIKGLMVDLEGLCYKRDQDIAALSKLVRDARLAGQNSKNVVMQRNLKRILALKKSRANVSAHLQTLETQLDCLESQTYNQQLVATMKASATTMRSLGLSQNLKEADQALSQLAEGMDTAGEITSALSVPMSDSINDDELDAELNLIMNDCGPPPPNAAEMLAPPSALFNSMSPSTMSSVPSRPTTLVAELDSILVPGSPAIDDQSRSNNAATQDENQLIAA
jgi:DNA-binding transcriptional ArsR family regulator